LQQKARESVTMSNYKYGLSLTSNIGGSFYRYHRKEFRQNTPRKKE
jgi:hypothetical protein